MSNSPARYSLDASTLIVMWTEWHPKCITWFDPLWSAIADASSRGEIMVCREVVAELRGDLATWVKGCQGMVQDPQEGELAIVSQIMADPQTRRLVDPARERPQADPYIIAQAELRAATVVSQEVIQRTTGKRPKIPDVCARRNVPCIAAPQFIRLVATRFGCVRQNGDHRGE